MTNVTVSHFQQSKLTIAGQSAYLSAFDVTFSEGAVAKKTYHEINLLDRSGSMYSSLDRAVDTLIERAKVIQEHDGFLSVGWFSSEGQHKFVFKGVKVTDEVFQLIETLRNTVGATCFNEILGDTVGLLKTHANLADVTVVNLLTDGQSCVYDVKKEMTASRENAAEIGKLISSFNAIGYGSHYNREFLVELTGKSPYGRFVHIEDVGNIYLDTLNILGNEVLDSRPSRLKITHKAANSAFIYTSGKTFISRNGSSIEFANFNSKADVHTLYVVTEEAIKTMAVEIEDQVFELKHEGTIDEEVRLPALYAMAYEAYLTLNDRKTAFDILKNNVKDKHLATQVVGAFTYSEIGATADLLYRAAHDESLRFQDGKCGPSFMPASATTSVFDVLNMLANDDEAKMIPFHDVEISKELTAARKKFTSTYNRTTRKVTDSEDIFKSMPGGTISDLSSLVYAEDRLNINIRFTIKGTAKINHLAAQRVQLPENFETYKYRNFSIIKDGTLNVKVLEVMVGKETAAEFATINKKHRGFIRYNEDNIFLLDLSKVPFMRSTSLEDVDVKVLTNLTIANNNLEVEQKAVKILIAEQESMTKATIKTGEFKAFTAEQIKVLEDHGIRSDGSYQGINKSAPKVDALDSYQTREVYTYVSGFSSLPSANAIKKKLDAGKKLTASEQAVHDAIQNHSAKIAGMKPVEAIKALNGALKDIRTELLKIRGELSMFKLTTILNNAWFGQITLDEKDSADLGDGVILKAKRVTEYV